MGVLATKAGIVVHRSAAGVVAMKEVCCFFVSNKSTDCRDKTTEGVVEVSAMNDAEADSRNIMLEMTKMLLAGRTPSLNVLLDLALRLLPVRLQRQSLKNLRLISWADLATMMLALALLMRLLPKKPCLL